jgi:outer membrane usher protein FimD/PapC
MRYIVLLVILFNLLNATENNSTKDTNALLAQKLFEKAFKKKASDKKLYFPLKVNGILQDEILIKIDASEHISIEKETIDYIVSLLKKSYQKKFEYRVKEDNFAPLVTLNQMGIKTNYDRDNITINVSIPPQLKKASKIRFNKHRAVDLKGSVIPEDYAGGINLYLNEYYKDNNEKGSLQRDPIVASSDMFLNIKNFIIEGRFNYQEENEIFYRDRVRIVKDDEANQIRYTVGDIFLPSQYRMSYPEALGMSIEKKVELSRDFSQNSSRINNYEFFLKNSSLIEIYVNNKRNKSLHLNAGTHNLYDLGIPNGLNQIKLKIIEDNGKIEFISFNDFSYSEVLQKGTLKYGLGVGVTSKREEHKFVYNKEDKLISAYVDYGLFNSITTKCGIQVTDEYRAMALEFIIGTNFGLFNPYIIYSQTDSDRDTKKGLDYRANIGNFNFNIGYENSGENFKRLDNYKYGKSEETILYRTNIYTPIGLGVNLGVTASQYTKSDEKEKKIGVRVYKKFFNILDARVNFDTIQKNDDSIEDMIYVTFEYRFGRERVGYTNYIKEKRHLLSSTYTSQGRYGLSNNMEYDHSEEQDKYYIQANLKDEKFKFDTTYTMNSNKVNDKKNQSLGIQLSTGFVFAGNTATITEPISSSFVIVNNDGKIEQPLGLDGYQDIDEHIYDSFALQLGDYTQRELNVDESELDFGIDLEKSVQSFYTNYKSGSVMDIKIQNLYSVKGVLIDKKTNEPIKRKAFKLFNREKGEKSMGFTNNSGKFTIEQVDIGTYNATLIHEEQYEGVAKFSFEIKEEAENLIDLGTIKIKMPKKKDTKKYIIFDGKNKQ